MKLLVMQKEVIVYFEMEPKFDQQTACLLELKLETRTNLLKSLLEKTFKY